MAYVFPSNSGELLRWTVASICINFLRPYLSDPVAKLDHVVEDLAFDADSAMADVGKLPAKISQWKLSTQEIGKWVKWSEEPNIGSSLEKEMSLSDIFITLTDLDLLMTVFMRRFLTTEDHFIVAGPTYCGKTATMKVNVVAVFSVICELAEMGETFEVAGGGAQYCLVQLHG